MPLPAEYDAPVMSLADRLAAQTDQQLATVTRQQAAFDQYDDECDAIVAARPLGSQTPRPEPKSIHSPAPAARVRFEPPKRRTMPKEGVRLDRIDWTNKNQVLDQASRLGIGMTVYQESGRSTYAITHTARRDRWDRAGTTVHGRT